MGDALRRAAASGSGRDADGSARPELPDGVTPLSALLATPPPEPPRPLLLAAAGWAFALTAVSATVVTVVAVSPLIVLLEAARRWRRGRESYHRPPSSLRVAIIGAGWSGLACAARLRALGVREVRAFDESGDVGGLWRPGAAYHGLQLHAPVWLSSFERFAYTADADVLDGKLSADEVHAYTRAFALARGLLRAPAEGEGGGGGGGGGEGEGGGVVRLHTRVLGVDYDSARRTASLRLEDARTGVRRVEGPFDLIVHASTAAGAHTPALRDAAEPGAPRELHVMGLNARVYDELVASGARVAVVGAGKSACDVLSLFVRAGAAERLTWVYRRGYLFYKYEAALVVRTLLDRVRGVVVLCSFIWSAFAPTLAALMQWGADVLVAPAGEPHAELRRHHFGVLCAAQRSELRRVARRESSAEPVGLVTGGLALADGRVVPCDVVVWATGCTSGLERLELTKDGAPFALDARAPLYAHFAPPAFPVLASPNSFFTTFGPLRGASSADMGVHMCCVCPPLSEAGMAAAASRQLGRAPASGAAFIFSASGLTLTQEWTRLHLDLLWRGIEPIGSFVWHAVEIFVGRRQSELDLHLLPPMPYGR